jgi:Ca2+-binding RTX toxin-like protein
MVLAVVVLSLTFSAPSAAGVVRHGGPGDERIVGTNTADRLYGGGGGDRLTGLGAADQLRGGGGDDILRGGPGRDLVDGGRGGDVLYADDDDRRDSVLGQAGDDTLHVSGRDFTYGGEGDDLIIVLVPRQGLKVDGGPGHDILVLHAASADGFDISQVEDVQLVP